MSKFEYKAFKKLNTKDVIGFCNKLGDKGWEIIEMTSVGDYPGDNIKDVYIFAKREIEWEHELELRVPTNVRNPNIPT